MITVRCLGHIGGTLGAGELALAGGDMDASELVERLRTSTGLSDPGFTRYNTLVMVEEGEAFVPAGSNQTIRDGSRVVLIPFSHGG